MNGSKRSVWVKGAVALRTLVWAAIAWAGYRVGPQRA